MQENIINIAYEGEEGLCHQRNPYYPPILPLLSLSLSLSPQCNEHCRKNVGVIKKIRRSKRNYLRRTQLLNIGTGRIQLVFKSKKNLYVTHVMGGRQAHTHTLTHIIRKNKRINKIYFTLAKLKSKKKIFFFFWLSIESFFLYMYMYILYI